jgi:hypothetical protein
MSAISPLSGDKRTSGERVENDANDQLPNSSTPFLRKKSPPFMDVIHCFSRPEGEADEQTRANRIDRFRGRSMGRLPDLICEIGRVDVVS